MDYFIATLMIINVGFSILDYFEFKKIKREKNLANELVSELDLYNHFLHQMLVENAFPDSAGASGNQDFFITLRPYELKSRFSEMLLKFKIDHPDEEIKHSTWGGIDYTLNPIFLEYIIENLINRNGR
ncbi:hypothetical protein BAS10_13060 [Elizabethkingia meningoseptica]|uniref:hypothetical protein n=1 Tax=Elizabethkingia meningoseptica TaxID=238 RepID=UPI00099A3C0A|nr:hypothetical protein [Elizabethkingia meningoseptica]OPB93728.1 hypothetical protein BAS10_13060 [Elizabethkingia meningoseptica]